MKKCGKKHIENRSGIACCGADYPFGPSGSFRDIVSVPELRPACRTSGKRPSVSHALCCPHVVRPFADSPWGAFCCRSCAPNVREASRRIPCAVLSACRPAVCRFAVGCLLLPFLRAERSGSVSPYPMRCAVRMSSGRLPIRRGVPFAAVLARRTFGKRLAVSHALCCPHVVRPFADSPWGAFCCRSCAPNVREASLRIPMRCAVRVSSGRLPIRREVLFAVVLVRRTSGKRPSVSHALCCPRVVCGMFLPTLPRLSGQCWGPFFRGRR